MDQTDHQPADDLPLPATTVCSRKTPSESWGRITSIGGATRAQELEEDSKTLDPAPNSAEATSTEAANTEATSADANSTAFIPSENFVPWIAETLKPRITQFLMGVNVVVFLLMTASAVFNPTTHQFDLRPFTQPEPETLISWGADFGPLTLGGQIWRVLSSNYVHIGITHLLVNVVMLWAFGSVAERLFGRVKFTLIYLVTGIAGSALSLLFGPNMVSAGASGCIMGLCGSLIGFVLIHKREMNEQHWKLVISRTLTFFVICVVYGEFAHANNAAHLGGFLAGIAAGAAFASDFGWLKFSALAAVVAGLLILDQSAPFDSQGKILLLRAQHLSESKQYAQALQLCIDGEKRYPKEIDFCLLAANILGSQKDFDSARQQVNLALLINKDSEKALRTRALINLNTNEADGAISDLTRLLSQDPANVDARALRAYAYSALNEPFLCLDDLKVLQEAQPQSKAWTELEAYATADTGNTSKALTLFQKISESGKLSDMTKGAYARTLAQSGKYAEAISTAKSIDDPKSKFRTLTYVYLDKKDLANARQSAGETAKVAPADPESHISLATVHWAQGEHHAAATEARKAFSLATAKSPRTKLYYLMLEAIAGDPNQEQSAVRDIAALVPQLDKSPWQSFLARYLLRQTRASYLLKMASNNNEATEAHAYIGLWTLKHGYPDLAQPQLSWVLAHGNKAFLEYMLVRNLVTTPPAPSGKL